MAEDQILPGNLTSALRKLADLRANMAADRDVSKARMIVQEKHASLNQANAVLEGVMEPYLDAMIETEDYIRAQAMELNSSFEYAGIKVHFRKGHTRYTVKDADLVKLIQRKPDWASSLKRLRNEIVVDPKVKIDEVK